MLPTTCRLSAALPAAAASGANQTCAPACVPRKQPASSPAHGQRAAVDLASATLAGEPLLPRSQLSGGAIMGRGDSRSPGRQGGGVPPCRRCSCAGHGPGSRQFAPSWQHILSAASLVSSRAWQHLDAVALERMQAFQRLSASLDGDLASPLEMRRPHRGAVVFAWGCTQSSGSTDVHSKPTLAALFRTCFTT